MHFLKQDLLGEHYTWEEQANKLLFSGNPSRREFNRYNGNQVLFIINFYGSLSDKFTVEQGRKMEELIMTRLPLEAKSEISVFNWLREFY